MNTPEMGQRPANRVKNAPKQLLESQRMSLSETSTDNGRVSDGGIELFYNKERINTKNLNLLFQFLIIFVSFGLTIVLASFNIAGDQEHYIKAYSAIGELSIGDGFDVYQTIIYTVEPLHYVITWIFSYLGAEKNYVMAIFNSMLAILYYNYLRKRGCGIILGGCLLFSNYYLMTMFFTLERTKFAFIFLLLYLNSGKVFNLVFALLSHTLTLLPIAANKIAYILSRIKLGLSSSWFTFKNFFLGILPIITAFYLFWSYFGQHLSDKYFAYSSFTENDGNFDGWQIPIMLAFTFLSAKKINRMQAIFYFVVLFCAAYILGGSRVNMLAYFGFIYFSDMTCKNFKIFSLMMTPYYLWKCIDYAALLINFGG